MHIGPIPWQEVTYIRPESTKSDLFFQSQGAGLRQEIFPAWPFTEDIEGVGPSSPFRLSQGFQQEAMVLYKFKITDGHQVPQRLQIWLEVQRSHEVTDNR